MKMPGCEGILWEGLESWADFGVQGAKTVPV